MTSTVDLFVVGADFYAGSTREQGRLKDGWCDFRVLGARQVSEFFGSSYRLGRIWYLASRVEPCTLRAFEESRRQELWLNAQPAAVTRILVDSAAAKKSPGELLPGVEYRFQTEERAVRAIQAASHSKLTIVVAADHERQTQLVNGLSERNREEPLLLVPPDFLLPDNVAGETDHLSHEVLQEARLRDETAWTRYELSKNRARIIAEWFEVARAEFRANLASRLSRRPYSGSSRWVKEVVADEGLVGDFEEKVARLLRSGTLRRRSTAEYPGLTLFIARKLLLAEAEAMVVGREGSRSAGTVESICNGRDLLEKAPALFPALRICESARRQIQTLSGNETEFSWIRKAFAKANCEMHKWQGGPFPHASLPGPASGESETVRDNPKLRNQRTFQTGCGQEYFEHHMKHGTGFRIHYWIDANQKQLLIGYVGPHLDTARF